MKILNFILSVLMLLVFSSCGDIISNHRLKYNPTDVPTIDKYKNLVVQFSHTKATGQEEGNRKQDDRITMSVSIPDYSQEKAKTVCRFYKEYYKTLANKLEGHLIVELNVFDSRNGMNAADIKKDKSYRGGMTTNYNTDDYKESF